VGDGMHDDTAAIQAAIDANQTGNGGTNLAKSPSIVYLPPGDYLISDTVVMWYYGHLVGNPVCPPTIRLAPSSPGYAGPALKPVLVTAGKAGEGSSFFVGCA
jgi:glucan 1,3-beta-glucosidase